MLKTQLGRSVDTPPTLRRENNKLCVEDKITAATALLVMKGVECGWSYSSMETLPEVCAKADPDSLCGRKYIHFISQSNAY